ncbi:MAG TPA: hypothetical protein VJ602_02350 [Paludibacter sp.]|nr:hypothetical protein [Paludibacter sp.]
MKDSIRTCLINSESTLKTFIGKVDNLQEVILLSKINGYSYDSYTIIGGAYRERKNDYLLYLMESSTTPLTLKYVRAVLTKKGEFITIDKKTYHQTDQYAIE